MSLSSIFDLYAYLMNYPVSWKSLWCYSKWWNQSLKLVINCYCFILGNSSYLMMASVSDSFKDRHVKGRSKGWLDDYNPVNQLSNIILCSEESDLQTIELWKRKQKDVIKRQNRRSEFWTQYLEKNNNQSTPTTQITCNQSPEQYGHKFKKLAGELITVVTNKILFYIPQLYIGRILPRFSSLLIFTSKFLNLISASLLSFSIFPKYFVRSLSSLLFYF